MCRCNCQCECHQNNQSLNPVVWVGLGLFSAYLLLKAFSEYIHVDIGTGAGVLFGTLITLGFFVMSLFNSRDDDLLHIRRTWAMVITLAIMVWLPAVPFWAELELARTVINTGSTLQLISNHPIVTKLAVMAACILSVGVWLKPWTPHRWYAI